MLGCLDAFRCQHSYAEPGPSRPRTPSIAASLAGCCCGARLWVGASIPGRQGGRIPQPQAPIHAACGQHRQLLAERHRLGRLCVPCTQGLVRAALCACRKRGQGHPFCGSSAKDAPPGISTACWECSRCCGSWAPVVLTRRPELCGGEQPVPCQDCLNWILDPVLWSHKHAAWQMHSASAMSTLCAAL